MRPLRAETDSTRVHTRVSGTATTSASVRPAVAMATVRQVSRATIARNSHPSTGGRKLARKSPVTLRFWASKRIQGLNSVATISGHSSTRPAPVQKTRPSQAGSREGGAARGTDGGVGIRVTVIGADASGYERLRVDSDGGEEVRTDALCAAALSGSA
jgi:hypothetical protein